MRCVSTVWIDERRIYMSLTNVNDVSKCYTSYWSADRQTYTLIRVICQTKGNLSYASSFR